ncbi:MAG: hypothetical protein FWG98_06840 [Candidatus Cloacimonetes bacterium]|nr:hypothetical protein [Candidatus Cloacimonadota bacterium]
MKDPLYHTRETDQIINSRLYDSDGRRQTTTGGYNPELTDRLKFKERQYAEFLNEKKGDK